MLAPFVFAVAIWVFAAEQGVVLRLLDPAIAIVGLLSYSIYLTHQIIIAMVNNGVQIGAKLISKNAASGWEVDFFANPWWMDVVVVVFRGRHDLRRLVHLQPDRSAMAAQVQQGCE